ncbi:hypothetical protein E1264_11820 [Actinomadura sp. KC216]|uniref:carbohydrate binding domain-containing protein n=1 Tax=Actinomadura sp. KC216 TaxID=2530370 RepID=UPI001044B26E|nr:carbohydrate binding domain-containing protein [Actinomadura sp. KC216]TDB88362.1 hypothetical protein E1264_11820 [Actinomadura sp. KC216]
MAHEGRLGTATVEASNTVGAVTVGQAVAAGRTVLGAVVWSQDNTTIPSISSVTDSRGNTYAVDEDAGSGNSTASCAIFRGRVTTPLQVGDTITVTIGAGRQRWCLQANAFDDVIVSPLDRTQANDNPGSSSSLSTGTTAVTQQARELAYGVYGFGRGSDQNITATGGWNADAQVNTVSASTKRGLQVAWIYLNSTAAVEGTATTSAPTTYSGCVATYRIVTDQTVVTGQAAETDAAQPITPLRTVPIGQAVEADAAQLIAGGEIVPFGQAAEADAATRFASPTARAAESEAAGVITPVRIIPIGLAVEADTASAFAVTKTRAIGQAAETDAADVVGPRVALAPETLLNGVPIPLGVRIYNNFLPSFDVWVTRAVDDFSFRSSIPGGFASATITLHRPSIASSPASGHLYGADKSAFDELARLFNRVQIVDMRSAEIVWEGRIEGPRRSTETDTWELSCLGAAVAASDVQRPMFYVDSSIESWLQRPENFWQFQADEATKTIEVRWEGNLIWPGPAGAGLGIFTALTHQRADECNLYIGRYDATFASSAPAGAGDQNPNHLWNSVFVDGSSDQGGDGLFHATNFTQNVRHWRRVNGALSSFGETGGWQVSDAYRLEIRMGVGNNAGFGDYTSAPDKVVGRIANPVVQVLRMDRNGTLLTDPADYPGAYVTVPQVVEDVVGRLLVKGWNSGHKGNGIFGSDKPFPGQVRPIDVHIDTSSTAAFTDLTYFDGATAEQILSDMMLAQPDAYWAIWESRWGATDGEGIKIFPDDARNDYGYRFEWARWPLNWGYQASSLDGLEEQPSGEGLYNYIFYKHPVESAWDETPGFKQTRQALSGRHGDSQTFPDFFEGNDLSYATVTRAITVTRDEPAETIGDAELAGLLSHYRRTGNAGTMTIRRPILYYDPGETSYAGAARMVQPWEIRPGKLIKITDVQPRGMIQDHSYGETTPPEAHDGTVWRVMSTEYSSSDNSCRLELDQPAAWAMPTQTVKAAQPGGPTVARGKTVTTLNANPFFSADLSGWTPFQASIVRSTAVVYPRGVASMRITPDGVSSAGAGVSALSAAGTVTPGGQYTGQMWAHVPGGTLGVQIVVNWHNAAGTFLSSSTSAAATPAAGVWTYLEGTFTAPASAARASILAWHFGTPPASKVWYAWGVQLVSVS